MKQIVSRIYPGGILLVAIMAISLTGCGCDSGGKRHKDRGSFAIITSDETALRIDPVLFSSRITLLARGTSVEILDRSQEKSWIGDNADYWYKVRLENGMTGWLYARNITILKTTSREDVESMVAHYWDEEASVIRQAIAGRWWSVDHSGAFTSHCLEISGDGKFRSFSRGNEEGASTGDYTINVARHEIVFSAPASFEGGLTYTKRGKMYNLAGAKGLLFKKISDRIDVKTEPPAAEPQTPESPKNPETAKTGTTGETIRQDQGQVKDGKENTPQ